MVACCEAFNAHEKKILEEFEESKEAVETPVNDQRPEREGEGEERRR